MSAKADGRHSIVLNLFAGERIREDVDKGRGAFCLELSNALFDEDQEVRKIFEPLELASQKNLTLLVLEPKENVTIRAGVIGKAICSLTPFEQSTFSFAKVELLDIPEFKEHVFDPMVARTVTVNFAMGSYFQFVSIKTT